MVGWADRTYLLMTLSRGREAISSASQGSSTMVTMASALIASSSGLSEILLNSSARAIHPPKVGLALGIPLLG